MLTAIFAASAADDEDDNKECNGHAEFKSCDADLFDEIVQVNVKPKIRPPTVKLKQHCQLLLQSRATKKCRLEILQVLLRSIIPVFVRSKINWGGEQKFVAPGLSRVVGVVFLLFLTNLIACMSRQISVIAIISIFTTTIICMPLLLQHCFSVLLDAVKGPNFCQLHSSSPPSPTAIETSNGSNTSCDSIAARPTDSFAFLYRTFTQTLFCFTGKHHRRKVKPKAESRLMKTMLLFSSVFLLCFTRQHSYAANLSPPVNSVAQQQSDDYDAAADSSGSSSNKYLPVYYPSMLKNTSKIPTTSLNYHTFNSLLNAAATPSPQFIAAASALDVDIVDTDADFDDKAAYPYVQQRQPAKTLFEPSLPHQKPVFGPTFKSIITIGGLFPMTPSLKSIGSASNAGGGGGGLVEAAQLALQHVNRHTTVLPEHELRMDTVDTTCDPGVGVSMFLRLLHQRPRKVMIFGGVCSNVTDPIAQSVLYWNITQLTYGDTHPKYSEDWQTRYGNFFQIVPSENSFNAARIALLRHFKWHKIGTIYQYKPRFVLPHNDLLKQLSTYNVQVNITVSFLDELKDQLDRMKEHNIRIIVGFFDEHSARQIFCRAYHIGLYGRRYQWIVPGEYAPHWWNTPVVAQAESGSTAGSSNTAKFSCTSDQLLEAIDGYISVDVLPLSTDDQQPTISEMTPSQFHRDFRQRFPSLTSSSLSKYYAYAYDGIWAIALAIQKVQEFLRRQVVYDAIGNLLMTIENDFSYRNERWGTLFRAALRNVTFDGVTGRVRFHHNSRVGLITVRQFQRAAKTEIDSIDNTKSFIDSSRTLSDADEVKVAEYNAHTGVLDFSRRVAPIVWKTSKPPKAEPRIVEEHRYIYPAVFVSMSVLAIVGIIVAVIFLCINIRYRNHRYIKMSSPYLNNLIVIGAIFAYIAVILFGLDSSTVGADYVHHVCSARVWVLSMGFTLAFGSMFSKTYRVNAIFTNVKLSRKVIKDYKLFIMVAALVLIDATVLTIWQFQFPLVRTETRSRPEEDPETADIVIPIIESCESISPQYMKVFNLIMLSYKGLLLIFACFLAWSTRKVSIPALNDSKYIGASVYNIVIFCCAGTAIAFVLEEAQQNYRILILSSFIIFCTTATLMLVFMPKVLELRRNPRPDAHSRRVRATLKTVRRERKNSISDEMDLRMRQLAEKNQKLRDQLVKKTRELDKLSLKLSNASPTMNITPSKVANNIHPHIIGASNSEQHFNASSSTTGDGSSARSSEQPQLRPQQRQSILLLRPATSSGDYRADYELTSQTLESSTLLPLTQQELISRTQTSSTVTKQSGIKTEHEKLQAVSSLISDTSATQLPSRRRRIDGDDEDEDEDAGFSVTSIESEQLVGGGARKLTFASPGRKRRTTSTNDSSTSSAAASPPANVSKSFSARRLSHFVTNIASHLLHSGGGGGARRSPSIRSASIIISGGPPPAWHAQQLIPREPQLLTSENATSLNILTNIDSIRRPSSNATTQNISTTTFTCPPPPVIAPVERKTTTFKKHSEVVRNGDDDDDDDANFGGVYVGAPAPSMGFGLRPRRSPPPPVPADTSPLSPVSTDDSSSQPPPSMPAKQVSFGSNDLSSPLHNLTSDVSVPLARAEDMSPMPNTQNALSADSTSTMMIVGMPTVLMGSGMINGQQQSSSQNTSTRLSPFPLLDSDSHIDFMSSMSEEEANGNGGGMVHEYENEDIMLRRTHNTTAQMEHHIRLVPGIVMSSASSSSSPPPIPTAGNTIVANEFKNRKLLAGGKQPDIIFLLNNGGRKKRRGTTRTKAVALQDISSTDSQLPTVSAEVQPPPNITLLTEFQEQPQQPSPPVQQKSWLARFLAPKSVRTNGKQLGSTSPSAALKLAPSRAAAARLSRRLPPARVSSPSNVLAGAKTELATSFSTRPSAYAANNTPPSLARDETKKNNGESDSVQVIKIHCDYEAHV